MSALNLCFFGLEIQMTVFIRNYYCAPLSLILTRSPFNLGPSWSTMSPPRSRRTPTEYSNARPGRRLYFHMYLSESVAPIRILWNFSLANTGRLWSHRIGIGSDLIVQSETCDTSGGTTLGTKCIADLKTKVVAPDKVCAQMSSPQHLVPAEKRENF
jgi:hypothetical protein